jgi:hypothetical protein
MKTSFQDRIDAKGCAYVMKLKVSYHVRASARSGWQFRLLAVPALALLRWPMIN